MKKTAKNLSSRKHLSVQKLRNSELRATRGGEIITCGLEGDLCKRLSVVVGAVHDNHKVVLASSVQSTSI